MPPEPPGTAQFLPNLIANQAFLFAIFGEEWARAHVTGFVTDPGAAGRAEWAGKVARAVNDLDVAANTFFDVSLFSPAPDGAARRRKELFEAMYVLVIDDVGTKAQADTLTKRHGLPQPSYELETSPGNWQWGYIFDQPETDQARIQNLINGIVAKCFNGVDPGMKGVTRYVRMPVGINTKEKYRRADGSFPPHKLTAWRPGLRFTLESLALPLGIDLEAPVALDSVVIGQDVPNHAIFSMIPAKGAMKPNGWTDVTCPWVHEHTDAADNGSAVLIRPNGSVAFECHHGHCNGGDGQEARTGNTLVRHLKDEDKSLDISFQGLPDTLTAAEVFKPIIAPKQNSQAIAPQAGQPVNADNGRFGLFLNASTGLESLNFRPDWLVKGLMERGQLGVLYGESRALKSYTALDLSVSLVTGADWCGHKVRRRHEVWFLAGEGQVILWRRLEAIRQARQLTREAFDGLLLSDHGLDLSEVSRELKGQQRLADVADARGRTPDLLIIDTLGRNALANENDTGEMGKLLGDLSTLAINWQCTVLLIHHTNKQGEMRGSKRLEQDTDFLYKLTREDTFPVGTKLEVLKLKGAQEPEEALHFRGVTQALMGYTDEDGEQLTDLVLEHLTREQAEQTAREAKAQQYELTAKEAEVHGVLVGLRDDLVSLGDPRAVKCGVEFDDWLAGVREESLGEAGDVAMPRRNLHRYVNTLLKKGSVYIVGDTNSFYLPT